ncbi:Mpp10 protein [Hymenopellis radicata]|nr:Mpp10 protein [Hymenopellis radicata]
MTEVESRIPPVLQGLSTLIDQNPQEYVRGSQAIQHAALEAAQFIFDLYLSAPINDLLSSLDPSEAPQTRSQSKKRKQQVWAQLDLKAKHMSELLERALEPEPQDLASDDEGRDEALSKALEALSKGEQSDFDFGDLALEDDDDMDEFSSGRREEEESSDEEPHEEGVMDLKQGDSSDEDAFDDEFAAGPSRQRRKSKKSRSSSELDDGFFDLRAFNADSEAAESRAVSNGRLDGDEDSDDESIDLFAPVNDDEGFEEADLENDSRGMNQYITRISSPSRRARPPKGGENQAKPEKKGGVRFHEEVRVKKIKAKGKNLPLSTISDKDSQASDDSDDEEGSEQYLDDTIDRFKDDLFADEEADTQQDMTTHEKRMAALKEQISVLEEENVGKKDWTLMGEATSRSRPQNSLLEEDLEFERVMKAAPIITEEVVKGLEDRIKARILDNNFDDVPFLPSRLFELKDTKSTQSLAQIYEDEYMATQAGGSTDDRDGKLKKEHDEIDKLWDNICYKLDALCNAHFTPKQPKATISSISNVSTTTLESALPTTQEVFKPSPSDLKARSEMTPAEKRALRGKVRKVNKKRRDHLDKAVDKYAKSRGGVKKQKEAALETAVKSGKGVTVVGKQRKDILDKNKKKAKS